MQRNSMLLAATALLSATARAFALPEPILVPLEDHSNVTARATECVTAGYATFYDDNACGTNGGVAVASTNGDCLANEVNRKSIYLQPPCGSENVRKLIFSPGTNCDCQNYCTVVPFQNDGPNTCWDISSLPAAGSYRFLDNGSLEGCPTDNCPSS